MGSLKKCIPGYVPSDQAQTIWDRVSKWENHFGDTPDFRRKAEVAAVDETLRLNQKRRQQVALSTLATEDIRATIEAAGNRPGQAFAARLVRDYKGVGSDRIDAESMQHVVRTRATVKAAPLMDLAAQTPAADVQAVSNDILRALAGKEVKNPKVGQAAHAWTNVAEWLKEEFNRLGGDIKKRADWLFPQTWDRDKVFPRGLDEVAAKERFVDELLPLYQEPERMHPIMGTDGAPLVGDELRAALADVAESIRVGNTQGTIGVVRGALKNKHLDPRVVGFRDVEDRIAFAEKFGNGNAFEVMDNHIQTLSREIGLMRVLGPSPDQTYAEAYQMIAERGYGGRGFASETKLGALNATYLAISGGLSRPGSVTMANKWSAARSTLSASLLSISSASQVTDVIPVSLTAAFNGLPVMRTLAEGIRALAPLAREDRAFLVRLGIDLDGLQAQLAQVDVMASAKKSRWLVEKTLHFNGTRKWTEAWYSTMQKQILGHMADLRELSLPEADQLTNGMLSRYGWGLEEWDVLRKHGIFETDGAAWASTSALDTAPVDDGVRNNVISRLLHTSQTEARVAMTMPDSRVRAAMGFGLQPGTAGGELTRTLTMFKSFSTQFALNQIGRVMSIPTGTGKAAYVAKLLVGTTAMGALSVQIKRLLKGQEPADMEDHSFWVGAMMQGGGFGILGDFASAGLGGGNRFGQGPLATLLGPGAGAFEDLLELTTGNVGQAARGEKANFLSEATKLAGRYAPLINLPFFGVASQRLLVDQVRLLVDPTGTRRSFMTTEQRQRQEFNSRFWWRPGETLPEFLRR